MELVSVIIPCYNAGEFVVEAIESALKQTYSNIEIIVVNDGSTDESTNKLLQDYSHPSVQVFHTDNQGVSNARNFGIGKALGGYILPLDADDKFSETYIEEAVKLLETDKKNKVAFGDIVFFGEKQGSRTFSAYSYKELLKKNSIHVSGLFKRSDFERVGGYDPAFKEGLEDWDFWLSLLKEGGEAVKLPNAVLYYRIRSRSRQSSVDNRLELRNSLRNRIVQKHCASYIEHYGNTLILLDRIDQLENIIAIYKGSRPYRLGKAILGPVYLLRRILKKEN